MKRLLFVVAFFASLIGTAEVVRAHLPSSFPRKAISNANARQEQLLFASEGNGPFVTGANQGSGDCPSHLSPDRVAGGITP